MRPHPIPAQAGDAAPGGNHRAAFLETSPPGAAPNAMPGGAFPIVLTLPPTGNKLWAPVRTRRGAAMVKRAASADWAAAAARDVARQAPRTIPGPFHAAIFLPVTRADIDGRIKPILDALQAGGAIANDRHCTRLLVELDASRQGTALIHLTPIPPPSHAPTRTKGHARKEPTS